MCDICNDDWCKNELKHMVIDMLWKQLKIKYPNLEIDAHSNSLHVIKENNPSNQVMKIGFYGDYMMAWRCVPRYESYPEKILAADPDFMSKIFDVLEGRRPEWKLKSAGN